jgi:5-methylcytosine-specific restriction endonuclease McrA
VSSSAAFPFELIEPFIFVPPGPFAQDRLNCRSKDRTANADCIEKTNDGKCAWCNVNKIEGNRRKYCSKACVSSCFMFRYPQSPQSKAWVLINRQSCACTVCGISHEDWVIERVARRREFNERCVENWEKASERYKRTYERPSPDVTYYQIGYNSGDRLHVDHVIPIHLGGTGIGFENIQIICVACHREKTRREKEKGHSTML